MADDSYQVRVLILELKTEVLNVMKTTHVSTFCCCISNVARHQHV